MAGTKKASRRLDHLGVRISRAEKSLVEAAAAAEEVTLSEFARDAVIEAAQRKLVAATDDRR